MKPLAAATVLIGAAACIVWQTIDRLEGRVRSLELAQPPETIGGPIEVKSIEERRADYVREFVEELWRQELTVPTRSAFSTFPGGGQNS